MMALAKEMFERIRSRKTQLALAIRVTVAAAAAYAIATALHLLLPLWAVLTSLIVTQMSVGRSLKATRDYMLGTVGGAVYGGAIAVLVLCAVLIPFLGVEGAAIAGAMSTFVRYFGDTYVLWRVHGIFLPMGYAKPDAELATKPA